MGIDDFIQDDVNTDDGGESDSDSDSGSEHSDKDAYEAYADLDEELNPEVAAIVDKVIQEWNDDRMVDAYIHQDYVRVRRADLVYGIVNIAKRTQKFFDEDDE